MIIFNSPRRPALELIGFCQRRSLISPLARVSGSKPTSGKVDYKARQEYPLSGAGGRVGTLLPRHRVWSRTLGEAPLSCHRGLGLVL